MLVRVKGLWVNPDAVVAIWYNRIAYHGEEQYWVAKMRCDEGQAWEWKYPTEEEAARACDMLANQVNRPAPSWSPLEGDDKDLRPHSRACGIRQHDHGTQCAVDCPTCGGGALR